MKHLVVAGALAVALSIPVAAQDLGMAEDPTQLFSEAVDQTAPEESSTGDSPAKILAWKAESRFKLGYALDPDNDELEGPAKAPGVDQDLQLTYTEGDIKVVLRGTATWTSSSTGASTTFRPQENHIIWSPDLFRVDAGWQVFSWGSADGINPTDVLNPRDYTYGLDSEKIPVFALSSIWYPSDGFSVEAICIPITALDRFDEPAADSIPDSLFYGLDLSGYPVVSSVVQTRSVLGKSLANGTESATVGGRLRGTWGATTLALSFVYGYDSLATPVVHVTGAGSVPVSSYYRIDSIDLENYRQYKAGLDIKTIVDRFGIWLEMGGLWTKGSTLDSWDRRHPSLSWTTGFDFNFGEADRNYLNLQYFGQWIPGYDDGFGDDYVDGLPSSAQLSDFDAMERYYQRLLVNSLGGQTEGLTQGLSVDLKLPSEDETITVDFKGVLYLPLFYDDSSETRYGSAYISPELVLKPTDTLRFVFALRMAYSWCKDADGDMALRRSNDNVGMFTKDNIFLLTVKYQWAGDIQR